MPPGKDAVKVRQFPSFSKSFLKLANYTLVNNCFNHVKGLEKLGHMVLHRDAVYIAAAAAEYNQGPTGTRTRPATRYFVRSPPRPDSVLKIIG